MRRSGGSRDVVATALNTTVDCAASLTRFLFPDDLLDSAEPRIGDALQGGSAEDEWSSRWWLVYTKSRQEKTLSRELSALRVPHYLPVHQREAITRGRTRIVEEPLFSGYLFLYADPGQRTAALTTNRISTTCAVSDESRLRDELWQLASCIAAGAKLTLEAKLEPGDWVRVKGGVHEGLEGTVIRRKNQTRLVLAVNFLKQGASLEVHESLLERIDPPQERGRSTVEITRRCGR